MPPHTPSRRHAAPPVDSAEPADAPVDAGALYTQISYNARRAWLSISALSTQRMAVHKLKVPEFSVLSLVGRNPGIISSQLCATLDTLPPNLAGRIISLERRGLIERRPHPQDRRAMSLRLTPEGTKLTAQAEETAARLEEDALAGLTLSERKTLICLLKKVCS